MMYTVLPELYRAVLDRLCDAIDGENYFSGTVAFRFDGPISVPDCVPIPGSASVPISVPDCGPISGLDCRLTVSVIVYRNRICFPEGDVDAISDLIPAWWEFHTSDADGEMLNDFSFSELRHCL